jgi:spore germination protein KB
MMTLILGKIGAKIVMFILCIFFCFCNIACLTLSIIFIKNYILFLTPTAAIVLSFLIPVVYISIKGLKTICRLSVFAFFGIMFVTIMFFIFGASQMNFELLKPVMADSSFLDVNLGGFITAARFSDILILLVTAYKLKDQNKTNKVFYLSIMFYIIIALLMLIPVLTTLGTGCGLQASNPYFVFARQVQFYTFLERTEVLVLVGWLLGALLKISIYHYFMAYHLSRIFNIKNYKYLVIPVVFITFLIIMLFGLDKSDLINTIRSDLVFPWIVLFFVLIVPLIVLIIYLFRRKKINKYKELMLQ